MSDGVPGEAAPQEIEAPRVPEEPKCVPLLPAEQAVLTGLVAGRNAVSREIEGYTNRVASRLGVALNRILKVDVDRGLVYLASDAPVAESKKEG